MEPFEPQQIGKVLLITGIAISLSGVIIILLGNLGLFKLPGDIQLHGKNWRVYFPIASCIVLSIIITLIMWLINFFKR